MSGSKSLQFCIHPYHTVPCRQGHPTRLCVACQGETMRPRGPATWLAACVLGVARRCECSDVAWMAYRACANDGRRRATMDGALASLRGTEGVKKGRSKAPELNTILRQLFLISSTYDCLFVPQWISTTDNICADALSRGQLQRFYAAANEFSSTCQRVHRGSE